MSATERQRRTRWIGPALAVALFGASLVALHRQLRALSYQEIASVAHAMPAARIWLALLVTAGGYAMLAGYDLMAFAYLGQRLPARRVALASFIAYAFSQSVGFPALTGAAIRYRYWSGWGLSAAEIAQGVAFTTTTFWLGLLTTAGVALAMTSSSALGAPAAPQQLPRIVGAALLLVVVGYLAWAAVWRRPLAVRGWLLPPPPARLAIAQVIVSTLDWTLMGSVLYALLPTGHGVSVPHFFAVFLLAQIAGLLSHAPGGIGVFDATVLLALAPRVPTNALAASLVLFRVVYYLVPLAVAAVLFASTELMRHAPAVWRTARRVGGALPVMAPDATSVLTFIAGAILLVSGATPGVHGRLRWLSGAVPLGVVEASHFTASIAGVMLLLLARGIRQRLDIAYYLTISALVVGVVASLLKGLDYEEALALGVVLAAVVPARAHFFRRAALTSEPVTTGWSAAVLLAVGGSLWLGLFSYKHVAYSNDLWWQFAFRADAPRFLRAEVGVVVVATAFALARIVRPARVIPAKASHAELDRAIAGVQHSQSAYANLVFVGDKALLFHKDSDAFLMYAVEGRSWVALGDPVGPSPETRGQLAWRFSEEASRHGGWPVFYEVGPRNLSLYLELGLTLLKLGEEARVSLKEFTLDTPARRRLRRSVRLAERAGCTFEMVDSDTTVALMPELRRVSDAWLALKSTREKGFSLGSFDETYLRRFALGVVRSRGDIVAFANVLTAADHQEASIDLMRHDAEAPNGVMDFLLARLMAWSAAQGYQWFNLGMAPLSGFQSREGAPLWTRLGALLYAYGGHFYNFRGLREYKEKFDPVWEPRYLAAPPGLALPRVMTNVATLVAGGVLAVVTK